MSQGDETVDSNHLITASYTIFHRHALSSIKPPDIEEAFEVYEREAVREWKVAFPLHQDWPLALRVFLYFWNLLCGLSGIDISISPEANN